MTTASTVRAQYESFPYPFRDPANELTNLHCSLLESFDLLNHYAFGGRKDFSKGFRALVAGGGTGDAALFLAEQLYGTDGEVVYLDLSSASMDVAQERAKVRGLTNIRWVQGSLLDVANLGLGRFDYINSSGVLHHLPDPVAGLNALKSVLAPGGALGIMVYAKYGRLEVYLMQDLMRLVNTGVADDQSRVQNTVDVIQTLHEGHPFRQLGKKWEPELNMPGHSGLYDLLLHSQDRAYTFPQLVDWVETCGLKVVEWLDMPGMRMFLQPEMYLGNAPQLAAKVAAFSKHRRYALAETIHGNLSKHSVFLTHVGESSAARFDDLELAPFFFQNKIDGADLGGKVRQAGGKPVAAEPIPGLRITLAAGKCVGPFLQRVDGKTSLKAIFDDLRATVAEAKGLSNDALLADLRPLYTQLNLLDLLLLRHPAVPAPLTFDGYQKRFRQRAGKE